MYHLTVQTGSARGAAWDIGEGIFLLGRSRDCAIQIPADTAVSRVHCELRVDGAEVALRHLSKRSVTLLNGKVVEDARLQAGDTLTVGFTTLILARNATNGVGDEIAPLAMATHTIHEANSVFLGEAGRDLTARVDTVRDLADLFHLANTFNEAETPAQLLESLSGAVRNRFAPSQAWFARIESPTQAVTPAPLPGFEGESPDALVREALCQAVSAGNGALIPGYSRDVSGQVPPTLLVAPLQSGGQVLGALLIQSTPGNAVYLESDLQFFVALCRTAAPCLNSVERLLGLRREVSRLRTAAPEITELLGNSEVLIQVRAQLLQVAQSQLNVLLLGESGTGKELAARMTHCHADFCDGPFVVVNCAAIPAEMLESELFGYKAGAFTGATGMRQGLIARANGGTLFLDEVGDLSPENQARLLRVLESGTYRPLGSDEELFSAFRVVSATNKDIPGLVASGHFRADLYHRLNGVELRLPPLREHAEDIPELAEHFFRRAMRHAKRPLKGILPEAIPYLQAAEWPGNVRELRNAIDRGTVLARGDFITAQDLSLSGARAAGAPAEEVITLIDAEKQHIATVFAQCQGDANETARRLGLSRSTFYHKLKKYGISAASARGPQE